MAASLDVVGGSSFNGEMIGLTPGAFNQESPPLTTWY